MTFSKVHLPDVEDSAAQGDDEIIQGFWDD